MGDPKTAETVATLFNRENNPRYFFRFFLTVIRRALHRDTWLCGDIICIWRVFTILYIYLTFIRIFIRIFKTLKIVITRSQF